METSVVNHCMLKLGQHRYTLAHFLKKRGRGCASARPNIPGSIGTAVLCMGTVLHNGNYVVS